MKALICGGRNYRDAGRVARVLSAAKERLGLISIIQGGADGADRLAAEWAWDQGFRVGTFNADWKAHGKAAGAIRNVLMLTEGKPDFVIAFPGGRGTAHMVQIAKSAGVKVYEISSTSFHSSPPP
jgi:predicted Rossmann-fold nucleotide-binding protein